MVLQRRISELQEDLCIEETQAEAEFDLEQLFIEAVTRGEDEKAITTTDD